MDLLNTNNLLEHSLSNIEIVDSKSQNNFLESSLGKTINAGLDIGLRWVLPDLIENQVIDIKESLIKGGLKEGIDKAISSAIDLGKSMIGIFTGKFESVSQAQTAIKNGGIIDGVSGALDTVIAKTTKAGLIPSTISNMIRQGKNVILDNISKNIEDNFASQLDSMEKLAKYENNWKAYFKEQDFEGMEREYKKIKERLKELLPLESTLKEARQIENLHSIIKKNGHDFNLSNDQLELANILV